MEALAETINEMKEHCVEQHKEVTEKLARGSKKFAIADKDIDSLKDWQTRQNGSLEKIGNRLEVIDKKIDDGLRDLGVKITNLEITLARGKPTWAVTFTFVALSTIVTGLAVYVISRGGL